MAGPTLTGRGGSESVWTDSSGSCKASCSNLGCWQDPASWSECARQWGWTSPSTGWMVACGHRYPQRVDLALHQRSPDQVRPLWLPLAAIGTKLLLALELVDELTQAAVKDTQVHQDLSHVPGLAPNGAFAGF